MLQAGLEVHQFWPLVKIKCSMMIDDYDDGDDEDMLQAGRELHQ